MAISNVIRSRIAAMTALCLLPAALAIGDETPGATDVPADVPAEISSAERDSDGYLIHRVRSAYQSGQTLIKVLLPDRMETGKQYPVLYVLPVEAGDGKHWGDGLLEVKTHDLHNKHRLICVFPTFSHLPWYADHPADPEIRQESYLLKVVLPFVDRTYPAVGKPEGRLLLGFSKSGWGAFSLLLRNPHLFANAAAWDAPLNEERPNRYGMGPIFGSQENFEDYRIAALLEDRAGQLRQQQQRLVLLGYDNFRSHHLVIHDRMLALKIPHDYRDGPKRKHQWHSGWVAEAVGLLASP